MLRVQALLQHQEKTHLMYALNYLQFYKIMHVMFAICSPPQLLMENAQRRESTFLMCVNKIIEFDNKVFKSEDDRMVCSCSCCFVWVCRFCFVR